MDDDPRNTPAPALIWQRQAMNTGARSGTTVRPERACIPKASLGDRASGPGDSLQIRQLADSMRDLSDAPTSAKSTRAA